jgi:hypothetical protein
MAKNKKKNVTAQDLGSLAGKAVERAQAHRAQLLEAAQLEEATGGLAIAAQSKPLIAIFTGQTDGLIYVPPFDRESF